MGLKVRIHIFMLILKHSIFSDKILSEVVLGQNEAEPCSGHFHKILEKPNEHIFMWHDASVTVE